MGFLVGGTDKGGSCQGKREGWQQMVSLSEGVETTWHTDHREREREFC